MLTWTNILVGGVPALLYLSLVVFWFRERIFSTSFRVVRYSNRKELFGGTQILFKNYEIFGVKVWSCEIDREDVPGWAHIQLCALGSTEWRSKFHEYM